MLYILIMFLQINQLYLQLLNIIIIIIHVVKLTRVVGICFPI